MKIYASNLGRFTNKTDLEILDALVDKNIWIKVFINFPIGHSSGYCAWWRIREKYQMWGEDHYDYDSYDQCGYELNRRVAASEFEVDNVHIVRPVELAENEDQLYFE